MASEPTIANNHGAEEEDFISRLPDPILHIILSKLVIRDAAVTTALSKRWASVFTTLPSLKINANSFNPRDVLAYPGPPSVENPYKWIYALCSVLDSRKTPIQKFEIDVEIFRLYHREFYVVFRELCVAGVEELLIFNDHPSRIYQIPSPVFWCNTIVNLELTSCELVVPSKLTGLQSVKSLMLCHVTVADNDLRRMISRCSEMEKLVIIDCHKVQNIVIRGPSLLELVISLQRPVGISLKSVPQLAFVEVSLIYDYDSWMNYHASFEERYAAREDSDEDVFSLSLRDFSGRDSGKTFEGTNAAANLVAFLNRIRSVKDLRLDFSNEYRVVGSSYGNKYCRFALELDFWDKQLPAECVKHHVTSATFYLKDHISEDCFCFPKFLLLNARNLKNMSIFYTGKLMDKPETAEKIRHEVLAVQKASTDVEMTIKPILPRYMYI